MDSALVEEWQQRAQQVILGGVNSPSRSYKSVGGGTPPTMARAQGAYLYDVDGIKYIDYLAAYGPVILGHAHPEVTLAVQQAAAEGILYGTPTVWEVEFAEMLQAAVPELERLRFVNSGTEAVMTTVRVARAVTGRTKLVKFAGCYHGHFDAVLVAAGSGPSSMGTPDSAGVPLSTAADVITVPFNDLAALEATLAAFPNQVAAVLVEPIVGNFGMVPPAEDSFLQGVIDLAHTAGSLVIFDEVITAFRFHYGTAAQMYGVHPDLYALGKIIGGGTPIGAYGGRRDIMESVAPLGPTYQAGTMAGNPLSMRAGMACLRALQEPGLYGRLDDYGHRLEEGIMERAAVAGIPIGINRVKGAFTVYFGPQFAHPSHPLAVRDYREAQATDSNAFAAFFHAMARRRVWLAPSKYEAWFVTAAHSEEDIMETLQSVEGAFTELRAAGFAL